MQDTASAVPALPAKALVDRKSDAMHCAPACVLQMVAEHACLQCSSCSSSDSSDSSRRFEIADILDAGGFATLLTGTLYSSASSEPQVVAAKIAVDMETTEDGKLTAHQHSTYQASMRREYGVYDSLLRAGGGPSGIPNVHFAGVMKKAADAPHPDKMHFLSFLVMDLLGPSIGCLSLEVQAYVHDRRLLVNHSLAMLKVLQCMHENLFVHCDVKPDNFCLPFGYNARSPGPVDTVYIIDMGMARTFPASGFDWDKNDCLYRGTVDYSSVRALRGYHPSPKDDLESLAIAMLEMAQGAVPFDLVLDDAALVPQRLEEMAAHKEKRWQKLLSQADTPIFIKQWMRHLRSMPPQHHPGRHDYQVLHNILLSALSPSSHAAASTWSCDASVLQLPAASTPATAFSSRKRPAPAVSAASNLMSSMSDADTTLHSKRLRVRPLDEQEQEVDGLLAVSQTQEE